MPLGIPEPLIVGRGINDVAIVTLTLSPKPEAAARWNEKDLRQLAEKVRAELDKADNVGLTYLAGGGEQEISVEPDPEKLSLYGVTLQQLEAKIKGANRSFLAGQFRQDGRMVQAVAGRTLQGIPDIGLLLVTTRDGRPVYVRDLARTVIGPSPTEQHVWSMNSHCKGQLEHRACRHHRFCQTGGRQRGCCFQGPCDTRRRPQGNAYSAGCPCRNHTGLRQDRQ